MCVEARVDDTASVFDARSVNNAESGYQLNNKFSCNGEQLRVLGGTFIVNNEQLAT